MTTDFQARKLTSNAWPADAANSPGTPGTKGQLQVASSKPQAQAVGVLLNLPLKA
ncbi:hypothetical protein [Pseudomonas sp. SWRI99]|uniref:hypothetical protein n=1 Tax=Pseudomonas sp. SWRI99 TaxID=2745506 RepID=UPI00164620EE|nr:hypothetical protein [Pseudomonas sp. SWRI99]MBC3776318.1 hypothetical protein [Pseudomonas sp. SWRI99]